MDSISIFLLLSLFLRHVSARLVNFTIDDSDPDALTGNIFTYGPSDSSWNNGNGCSGCYAKLDASQVLDGTWHDATFDPGNEVQTAHVEFNGSAIYVFGVLSQATNYTTTVDISFYIDGQLAGGYAHIPNADNSYTYNVCLWANDSIGPGMHTFQMQNGRAGGNGSLVLFDYIIYSQEKDVDSSSTDPSSLSTTPIATSMPTLAPSPTVNMSTPSAMSLIHTTPTRIIVIASVVPSVLIFGAILTFLSWRCHVKRSRPVEKSSTQWADDLLGSAAVLSEHERQNALNSLGVSSHPGEQQIPVNIPYTMKNGGRHSAETLLEQQTSTELDAPPSYDSL